MKLKRRISHVPVQEQPKPGISWSRKILYGLSRTNSLWQAVESEQSVLPAFKHALVCLAIGIPLNALFAFFLFLRIGSEQIPVEILFAGMVTQASVMSLMMFAVSIVMAGLVHGVARLVGANKGWKTTFKAMMYGFTPYYILFAFPLVFFVALVWSMKNQFDGLMYLHQIDGKRAFVSVLPMLLLVLALFLSFVTALTTPGAA